MDPIDPRHEVHRRSTAKDHHLISNEFPGRDVDVLFAHVHTLDMISDTNARHTPWRFSSSRLARLDQVRVPIESKVAFRLHLTSCR